MESLAGRYFKTDYSIVLKEMVESPCIKICYMDEAQNLCVGCYRTLDEIARWGMASDAEKKEILKEIEVRKEIMKLPDAAK